MDAAELDQLVAQIGEEILARTGRTAGLPRREGLNIPDLVCPGCTQRCPQTCERKAKEIVKAGASRLSASDTLTAIDPSIAGLIDHTLLRPEATREDILKVCREARKYSFASVCINPYWVPLVAAQLAGSPVKVCTVIGFPLGATSTEAKVAETEAALRVGAQEIDMVENVGALRGGDHDAVKADIAAVVEVTHEAGAIVKVILETALLDDNQKVMACMLAKMAKADFVKTSTGFGPSGRNRARCRAHAPGGGSGNGRESVGRNSHAGRCEEDGCRRSHTHRSQRERQDRGSYHRCSPGRGFRILGMATPARKSTVRFQERAELLDFLLEVSAATSESLDLDRIMANVAEIVKEVIPYDLFAILLYSELQRGLSIRYSIGHREEIVRSLVLPLGEGITGAAAATRQPILVSDVRNDPRYLTALDAVQSELAVPMLARGKLVGVIDLQSTRLNAYREQDRSLLQLIATRVAVSMDNARLYRRVDRQNRTLKTLSNLSQEFSSILDLDELLGKIAKTIHALVAFDAFSILLLDAERKVLTHRFSERYDKRVDLDNIPLGKGLTGAAAESREIVRVTDTAADPRYIASHPEIRSEIAVPLVVQDRVVGVMDLESERMGFFTEEHSRLLATAGATDCEFG